MVEQRPESKPEAVWRAMWLVSLPSHFADEIRVCGLVLDQRVAVAVVVAGTRT